MVYATVFAAISAISAAVVVAVAAVAAVAVVVRVLLDDSRRCVGRPRPQEDGASRRDELGVLHLRLEL